MEILQFKIHYELIFNEVSRQPFAIIDTTMLEAFIWRYSAEPVFSSATKSFKIMSLSSFHLRLRFQTKGLFKTLSISLLVQ